MQGIEIGARRGLLMPTGKGGQAAEWMLRSLRAPPSPAVPFAVQRIRCDWHSLAPSVLTLVSVKWISLDRTWGGLSDLILTLPFQRSAEAAELRTAGHTQVGRRSSQACQGVKVEPPQREGTFCPTWVLLHGIEGRRLPSVVHSLAWESCWGMLSLGNQAGRCLTIQPSWLNLQP